MENSKVMKGRIEGIDVARALAVFGMIIINFKMVLGSEGYETLHRLINILEGKASATFVVLAGVGLALMSRSTIATRDHEKFALVREHILKRAVLLFVLGLSCLSIWPADILHFYSLYMLVAVLYLRARPRTILFSAFLLTISYPLLMTFINYENGWDFGLFTYHDFWTVHGFIRHLFYNGFHPVFPWSAYMLIGLWYGKCVLHDHRCITNTLWGSLATGSIIVVISHLLIAFLSQGNPYAIRELKEVLGTSPMPPLPIYMISGGSTALFTISACILLAKKFKHHVFIRILNKTGRLALTFYVAHIVLGMGLIDTFFPEIMGQSSLLFSFLYAIIFSILCVGFANLWLSYYEYGPLESLIVLSRSKSHTGIIKKFIHIFQPKGLGK